LISKILKNFKIVLNIVAPCLLLFGFIGFFMNAGSSAGKSKIEKYYKQHPLNEKHGIVVDSDGNIYIGEGQTGSIQVYDSMGNFQYGIAIPTYKPGYFGFGIEQDKIHIVTARDASYYIFDRGELVSSENEIDDNRMKKLEKQYPVNYVNSYVTNNKIYKILSFNTVSIDDKVNGEVEKIYLDAPIWPFSTFVFWGIGATGMGLIYLLNRKFFLSMSKEIKHNLKSI